MSSLYGPLFAHHPSAGAVAGRRGSTPAGCVRAQAAYSPAWAGEFGIFGLGIIRKPGSANYA